MTTTATICFRLAAKLLVPVALTVLTLPVLAFAQSETIEYYGLDALGSVRAIFDPQGNVVGRMDYGPFGENLRAAIKFPTEQFAQLNRGAESGQDYAQARNYSPTSGRLSRVDPVYQGLFAPQRWNRYTYARNNPLLFVDPTGLVEQAPIVEVPCPTGIAGPCFSTSTTVSASEKSSMWSFIFGFWEGEGTPRGGDDGGGGSSGFVHWDPKQYCAANPSRCDANGNVQVSMAGIPNGPAAAGAVAVALSRVGQLGQQGTNAVRNVTVYLGKVDGKAMYVGITNNVPRRVLEHGSRYVLEPIMNGLTRLEARAIEQALIEGNPSFRNIINSISPLNPIYAEVKDFGVTVASYLRSLGLW